MNKTQFAVLTAVIALFGFAGGVFSSRCFKAEPAKADAGDVISANSFHVTDGGGALRLMMTTDETSDAPMIILLDAEGKTRSVYALSEKGEPVISMTDSGEVLRSVLAVTDSEGAAFEMYDASGDKKVFAAP